MAIRIPFTMSYDASSPLGERIATPVFELARNDTVVFTQSKAGGAVGDAGCGPSGRTVPTMASSGAARHLMNYGMIATGNHLDLLRCALRQPKGEGPPQRGGRGKMGRKIPSGGSGGDDLRKNN